LHVFYTSRLGKRKKEREREREEIKKADNIHQRTVTLHVNDNVNALHQSETYNV